MPSGGLLSKGGAAKEPPQPSPSYAIMLQLSCCVLPLVRLLSVMSRAEWLFALASQMLLVLFEVRPPKPRAESFGGLDMHLRAPSWRTHQEPMLNVLFAAV